MAQRRSLLSRVVRGLLWLSGGWLVLTVGAVLPPLAPLFGFLCGIGLDLTERIVEWAQSRPDVRLVTPADPARRAGVISFASESLAAMAARLTTAQITHTVREGAVRLSPHCYNTEAEIERVLEILDN